MASYHCTVKAGGKGRAGPHSDYIEREGKYAPELAQGKSKLEDLEHKSSGNMPAWAAHDAGIFWRAADEHERANGATYREIEIALPRELNPDQRRALVDDFINQQIGSGHAFTFAIHIPKAAIEKGDQPHAHIMYSERTLDGIDRDPEQYFKRANTKNPEKGGCKKDSAGTKERLLATRELWAKVQNAHLEKAGCEDRVSHLSLKARGIDREPEKHLGHIDAKKIDAADLVESRGAERELELTRKELSKIDISGALAQAQREADARSKAEVRAQEMAAEIKKAAAAQVQVTADLLTAAKAKAKEKEDDRVRDATFERIGNNISATNRASDSNRRVIESSRGNLVASAQLANSNGARLNGAGKGAERRVTRGYLESGTGAVRDQLDRVGDVLRQAGRIFSGIVKTIARAAQLAASYVEAVREIAAERKIAGQQLNDLISQRVEASQAAKLAQQDEVEAVKKASERPLVAAQVQPASAPAKVVITSAKTQPVVVFGATAFDLGHAQLAAKQAREHAATLDVNAAAAARGIIAVPYPGGGGPWAAEHHSSYETAHNKAVKEVKFRQQREPRPLESNKKVIAVYDARTTELEKDEQRWADEIKWRDAAFKAASAARQPDDAAHIAAAKAAHDIEQLALPRSTHGLARPSILSGLPGPDPRQLWKSGKSGPGR